MTEKLYPTIQFFIDGQWTCGTPPVQQFQDVENPADGSVLGVLPKADSNLIQAALVSARKGQAIWRTIGAAKRSELINRASELLRERVEEIAQMSSLELGTPISDARNYVHRAADILEWDAAEGRRIYGRVVPSDPGLRQMVVPEPVGIVAAFSPWNAPVLTPCRKIGSALAAGCAIILKAAEETPACAMAVVQAFCDAGVPAGVVNLIYGNPALISQELIDSQDVRMVTFTGSVPIGKQLAQRAASHMKPVLMELGGHAPVVVCEDSDVKDAARRCAQAKFRNGGQACLAPTRFFIHQSIYSEFEREFLAATQAMKMGSPFDQGVAIGPLSTSRRRAAVHELVCDAVERGARLVAGGVMPQESGYFYPPTVLADIPWSSRVLSEEPFGPVACLTSYTDLGAVIADANALPFGLAGYVFTRDAGRAELLANSLQCGAIAINHLTVSTTGIPFGGVKDSGLGREGGTEGVRCYTVPKTITHMFN